MHETATLTRPPHNMGKNPYEPLEDISRRLKMSLETTMQSHTQFRCTELRLHNIGLEMSQLLNRAKTGNELLKVEYNNEERGGDEREANLPREQ
jgi:hypothetical protein